MMPSPDTGELTTHAADTGGAPVEGVRPIPAGLRGRIVRMALASGCPKRTAAAFAFGVFLSFSPFFGLQIVIAFGIAFALRLSRAAMFVGLCANMPWFMLPWYTLTTALGAFILQVPVSPDTGARLARVMENPIYRAAFWHNLADVVGPFLWAFVVGSTLGAALAGVVAFVAVTRVLAPLHAQRVGEI